MSAPLQLALYSAAIALATMGGALVPTVLNKERHGALLAFAAGIMLGAAFFQMLPEAFHSGGYPAFALVPVGFLALLLLERFVLVYASEEPPDCAEHGHGGSLGLAAFIGMSVHTLFDGVALASSVAEGIGLTAFVAITAHKVSSSLGLASILRAERRSTAATLGFAAALGGMVPLGAGLAWLLGSLLQVEALAARSLAFSAGSFLYVAVSDLLPHVNRHGHGKRWAQAGALLAGLGLMYGQGKALPHHH
ncbi:MAG: ZIP family metal transporter [Deltaproteobacteria bacterium]|nr:ZIP family metal transporter [Deltaproteobacteria bacterium]